MKKITKIFLLALGFGLLAVVVGFLTSSPAPAQAVTPVTVVNSTANPVPTLATGTTLVAVRGGFVNANVTNPATRPVPVRDVDNPARQAFLHTSVCVMSTLTCSDSFTVPGNQELVIETISVRADMPTGQKAFAEVITQQGSATAFYSLPLTLGISVLGITDALVVTQPLRAYAGPGTTVTLTMRRDSEIGGSATAEFAYSGYLVNCGASTTGTCPLP